MKKLKIFFLLLPVLLSCNSHTQKKSDVSADTSGHYHGYYYDNKPLEDSTWYNLIEDAWEKQDTGAIRPFFESWYQHTIKTDRTPELSYRTIMDTIFKIILDDGFRFYEESREYAIFDSEIYYAVIDTAFRSFKEERDSAIVSHIDTMYFRPDDKLLGRKVIMWSDPYRRYIDLFLKQGESIEFLDKIGFIQYYIKGGFSSYFEEPQISILILNKNFDAAYVEYHDIETGMAAWLIKRDGKWIITQKEQRYIS